MREHLDELGRERAREPYSNDDASALEAQAEHSERSVEEEVQEGVDDVAADESGAACDEYVHDALT